MTEEEKISSNPDSDNLYNNKNQQGKQNRPSVGKSSTSKPSTPNTVGINNGGKIRLRERRSNSGIKSSQNPHRASYPSALLPTVTENRSFDNLGQYNSQSHQRSQTLNKQDSDTNLSTSVPTSRNNSNERLSGTDGE
jgi:hypothetical protein